MRHAAFFDQPIHATCSGTFEGFERHYHRSGKLVNFIKLHNDFKDTMDPSVKERSDEEIAKLTKADVTQILKDCASVGLGGSSFPTYVKMAIDAPIKVILINGIECEPYITSDQRMAILAAKANAKKDKEATAKRAAAFAAAQKAAEAKATSASAEVKGGAQ